MNFSTDDTFTEKINLDELYQRKKEVEDNRIQIYQKILERIHKKIKITSRQNIDNQICWYLIPEIELGCPLYNKRACLDYVLEKLIDNGLLVKYTHPNLLLISWGHYIPNYERQEYKKKTGTTIDGFGNIINNTNNDNFNNVNNYKPTGKLIYSNDILNSINKKAN